MEFRPACLAEWPCLVVQLSIATAAATFRATPFVGHSVEFLLSVVETADYSTVVQIVERPNDVGSILFQRGRDVY